MGLSIGNLNPFKAMADIGKGVMQGLQGLGQGLQSLMKGDIAGAMKGLSTALQSMTDIAKSATSLGGMGLKNPFVDKALSMLGDGLKGMGNMMGGAGMGQAMQSMGNQAIQSGAQAGGDAAAQALMSLLGGGGKPGNAAPAPAAGAQPAATPAAPAAAGAAPAPAADTATNTGAAGAINAYASEKGITKMDFNDMYKLAMNPPEGTPQGVVAAAKFFVNNPQEFAKLEQKDVKGADGLTSVGEDSNMSAAAQGA
jgi:hypothetical protein